jgi:hypothetical protein
MSLDVLILGGIAFTGFSTPDRMMFGGRQAMVVHKLPGGSRVIDTLGPDDAAIAWHGQLFDDTGLAMAIALDGMRSSGAVQSLSFAGLSRSVIIDEFLPRIARLPIWIEYSIICTVVKNSSQGGLLPATGQLDSLITSDLAQAVAG